MEEEQKKSISEKGAKNDKEKARELAMKRLRRHRIRVASTILGVIAVLAMIFFVFIAHYDFHKKAWIVKWDPIHGFAYTLYTQQEYSHSRIVITSSSKTSESITIPDTMWGARVEELADNSISDSVKNITLGKYVYLLGEGFGSKTISVDPGYAESSTYLSVKDKDASGFYYKLQKDSTMVAFAYFGTEEAYQVPSSICGVKVARCTEYYVNDDYLSLLAETFATHESTVPFNMVRVKMIQQRAIAPYMNYLTKRESRENTKTRLFSLPDQYNFNADGSPADGETAIKMALINNGDGKGNNCALVMAKYPPLDFIAALKYLGKNTQACLEGGELNIYEWIQDGMKVCG